MSTPRTLLRSLCSPRLYQYNTANTCYRASTRLSIPSARPFSAFSSVKMPSNPSQGEINSQTDPSVAKQYDTETSKVEQITDYFKLVDGMKISMLNTYRNGVGPVGRSMAVAKRNGPDILYIGNGHAKKFSDLDQNKEVQITFQDTKTQDWISITGTANTISNSDPRIKELHNKALSAWFGDVGDGKHDGSPNDPRMTLIEVKANYVVYYKTQVGSLGFIKEVGVAAVTGKVAQTGLLRELHSEDLEKARTMSRGARL